MLNSYNFKSIFKNELNYFIKYKRSLGLKYEKEILRLKYIDNILYNLNIKSKKITKATFYKLIERNNMHGENYARQYGVTKDFCKFLISNNLLLILVNSPSYATSTSFIINKVFIFTTSIYCSFNRYFIIVYWYCSITIIKY